MECYASQWSPYAANVGPAGGDVGHLTVCRRHHAATVADAVSLHGPVAPLVLTQRER